MLDTHIRTIAGHYGLDKVNEIRPIYGGTANKNYIVDSSLGKFVLRKKNPKYSLTSWIEFEADFIRHLHNEGIPVPVALRTMDDRLWVAFEEDIYQMYTYLGGVPFDGSMEQIGAAGALLGKYHIASRKFDTLDRKQLEQYDNPEKMLTFLSSFIEENKKKILSNELRILEGLCCHLVEIKEKMSSQLYFGLPQTVIHGDYHPANILYEGNNVSGLFDFDWASLQPRIRDIADGILFFACDRKHNFDGGDIYSLNQGCTFNMSKFDVFISSYVENESDFSITKDEISMLPFFLKARLINCRLQAVPKVQEDKRIFILTNEIDTALASIEKNIAVISAALLSRVFTYT